MTLSFKKSLLDKFYTKPEIVDKCLALFSTHYKYETFDLIIEPACGNGSFFNKIQVDNKLGIDIQPENDLSFTNNNKDKILQKDFLTYKPQSNVKNILIIGNPPFGRKCYLAVKFFNHASSFSNVIAFIVPQTFRRLSIQNRLDLNFHLNVDESLPSNCFEPFTQVKCCFQIWERKDYKRSIIKLPQRHKDWDFLQIGDHEANFVLRTTGGVGKIILNDHSNDGFNDNNLQNINKRNYFWIKANINTEFLIKRFQTLDYTIANYTSRHDSIGKADFVKIYSDVYKF